MSISAAQVQLLKQKEQLLNVLLDRQAKGKSVKWSDEEEVVVADAVVDEETALLRAQAKKYGSSQVPSQGSSGGQVNREEEAAEDEEYEEERPLGVVLAILAARLVASFLALVLLTVACAWRFGLPLGMLLSQGVLVYIALCLLWLASRTW